MIKMFIDEFENVVENVVDELNVEINDDEFIYNSNLSSCFFYINQFFKNELLNDIDDEIKKINDNVDELINEFEIKLRHELNNLNFNLYVVDDEIEIELIDDVFDDDVDELYDEFKIYF